MKISARPETVEHLLSAPASSVQIEISVNDVFVLGDINSTVSWSVTNDQATATYCPALVRAIDNEWVFRCNYTGVNTTARGLTADIYVFFLPKSSSTTKNVPIQMVALPPGAVAGADYSPPISLNYQGTLGSLGMLRTLSHTPVHPQGHSSTHSVLHASPLVFPASSLTFLDSWVTVMQEGSCNSRDFTCCTPEQGGRRCLLD